MKRLFQRLDGAGGRQSPVTSSAQQLPATDPSCVKDFIGKVFAVNKQTVVVEDVIAEGMTFHLHAISGPGVCIICYLCGGRCFVC
jgi:hypothetical protein